MFVVRFTSGLGNQMFQYCFYLLLKKLYPNAEVKADLTWFYAHNDHHGYELQRIFGGAKGFALSEASYRELFQVTGLVPNLCMPRDMLTWRDGAAYHGRHSVRSAQLFEEFRRYPNRILREFTLKKRLPYYIDETGKAVIGAATVPEGSDDSKNNIDIYHTITHLDTTKDYYFTGFWIEERYFGQVLSEAREAFLFPELQDQENLQLKYDILSTNAVSIHVRRGDYLTTYQGQFKTLPREYYETAMDIVCAQTGLDRERLTFYIFSDDPDFVRSEFDFVENKRIVSHNTGAASFRDMQLMSLCKHNIIANSTFSQWAALLNPNEDSLTIYPRFYLKDKDSEIKSFPHWICI